MAKEATRTVSIIGGGAVGTALVRGFLAQRVVSAKEIIVCDRSEKTLAEFQKLYKIRTSLSVADAYRAADVVILAVKPKDLPGVLKQCGKSTGKIVLSVAVGATISDLKGALGKRVKVGRVLPNVAAAVGQSMSVIFSEDPEVGEIAEFLFSAVGRCERVIDEQHLAVTCALSASGPAFLALVAEGLIDGCVKMGLPRNLAQTLTMQTFLGTGALASAGGLSPEQISAQVVTPGGTTIRGLHKLENDGVRGSFISAIEKTTERFQEFEGGRKRK